MKKKIFFFSFIIFVVLELFLLYLTSDRNFFMFLGGTYLRSKLSLLWLLLSVVFFIVFLFLLKFVELKNTKSWTKQYIVNIFLSDILVMLWCLIAAQIAKTGDGSVNISIPNHSFSIPFCIFSIVLSIVWILILFVFDSFNPSDFGSGIKEYSKIAFNTTIFFGILAISIFVFDINIKRSYFTLSYPIGLIGLIIIRRCWRRFLVKNRSQKNLYKINTIILGDFENSKKIVDDLLKTDNFAYKILSILTFDSNVKVKTYKGVNVKKINNTTSGLEYFRSKNGSLLIISGKIPDKDIMSISWYLNKDEKIAISSGIVGVVGPRLSLIPLKNMNIIGITSAQLSLITKIIKRVIDIFVSIIGVVIFAILFIFVAPLIKLTSKGPIFYKQKRIGQNKKEFNIIKFRSMADGSDKKLKELLKKQKTSNKPLFKVENDPRITKFGAFIRKYSIDEVPQFLNVLKGDMSLVGPRPQVEDEVKMYKKNEGRRLYVKPGITGLWQINGRSDLEWENALGLDLYYVENYSILLDIQIIFHTFKVILSGKGAK